MSLRSLVTGCLVALICFGLWFCLWLLPASVGLMGCETKIFSLKVRPTDIDVKGHVNNARYVEYLQWARWEYFEENGLSTEELLKINASLVIVNLNINYRKECKNGDLLAVVTTVEKLGEKSVTLKQEIRKGDQAVLDATVVLVAIDVNTRKSVMLPETVKAKLTK